MPFQTCIGIDPGTHKTLVARWDDEASRPVLVRLQPTHGDDVPSSIHADESGNLSFGDDAEALGVTDPEGYIRGFTVGLGNATASFLLHSHEFRAQRLTCEYLRWIKSLVEGDNTRDAVGHAVICVPAGWLPVARNILRDAALEAGFPSVELIDRPVAIAQAFRADRPGQWLEGPLLIFDWGASTLELSVVAQEGDQLQWISDLISGGYAGSGGEGIDRYLMHSVNKRLMQHGFVRLERRAPEEIESVRRKVVEWKIRCASKPRAIWRLLELAGVPPDANLTWTSEEIRGLVEEKIEEAVDACAELWQRAAGKNIYPGTILLAGGSSQFPALTALLSARLPEARIVQWDQRIAAATIGAACQAGSRSPGADLASLTPDLGMEAWIQVGTKVYVIYDSHGHVDDWRFTGGYGFVNQSGQNLIPSLSPFGSLPSEGLVSIKTSSGKYGFADAHGTIVIEQRWNYALPFKECLAGVQDPITGKWGFIDHKGELVIPAEWDDVQPFSEGFASVVSKGKYGFINRMGIVVIQPQWHFARGFRQGLTMISTHDWKYGIADKQGRVLADTEWDHITYGYARSGGHVSTVAAAKDTQQGFGHSSRFFLIRLFVRDRQSIARVVFMNREGEVIWRNESVRAYSDPYGNKPPKDPFE